MRRVVAEQDGAANLAIVHRCAAGAGDAVTLDDTDGNTVMRLASGLMMLEQVAADGRRYVAAFKHPGDLSWPSRDHNGMRTSYLAVQPSDFCLIRLSATAFHSSAAAAVIGEFYEQARGEVVRLQEEAFVLARMTATEKLARFILELAKKIGRTTDKGIELKLPMRREQIADHLGMKPETISRLMSGLKAEKLIYLPRPTLVIIPDLRRIGALAKCEPIELAAISVRH